MTSSILDGTRPCKGGEKIDDEYNSCRNGVKISGKTDDVIYGRAPYFNLVVNTL